MTNLLTVSDVAERTHRHPETVTKALRRGDLHGYQGKKRAHWIVQEECAVAWRIGEKCEHQLAEGRAGKAA